MNDKPILAIAFEECVAQNYAKEGFIVAGFFDWAVEAFKKFRLVIYSNDVSSETMDSFVRNFLIPWRHQKLAAQHPNSKDELKFEFVQSNEKPVPFLTIDAKSVTFTGRWDLPFLNPEELEKFKPGIDPQVLYKLPEDLGRPDAAQRAATAAPPPDAIRKCPRHPWMTRQNNDGSRDCMVSSCGWKSPAPRI
jgi:hypothetical protein